MAGSTVASFVLEQKKQNQADAQCRHYAKDNKSRQQLGHERHEISLSSESLRSGSISTRKLLFDISQ